VVINPTRIRLAGGVTLAVFKRVGEQFELPVRHPQAPAQLAPPAYGPFDFPQDFLRPFGHDSEIHGDREKCLDGGFRAGLLGNPCLQLPGPIRK
jgi:hypothetical protein